jgi:PmbA protein
MQTALAKGAQEVSVNIFSGQSSSVEVRNEKIDKLEQANQAGMSVRLIVDRKYSVHSTNRLDNRNELKGFLEEAISGTKYLSEDEYRSLPDPSLYYRGGGPELATRDSAFEQIEPDEKIKTAFALEKEILGTNNKILSLTTAYSDGLASSVMITSNGFEGDTSNSYYGVSASVSVDGGNARPQSGWSDSSVFYNKLIPEGVASTALERAIRKIGQKKIASGKMTMIVENRLGGQLLGPLVSALNGSAIQQRNSFLVDSMNKQLGSEMLNLVDDPFIPSGRGSKHFDNEGLALSKRIIFESGVLRSFYIDTYYGKKLGMAPTSGSTSNLVLGAGNRSLEEILASVERGILITGFNGGNTNGATGDFSYGIEGFLIEDGKEIQPVSEMNITGNMKDLWMGLAEAGSDVYDKSSWRTPCLVFKDVDFSGK